MDPLEYQMKRLVFLVSLLVALPMLVHAAWSTERLARIDRLFQQYVDENRIAGAVALVLQDGRPVYERAFGWSDKEAGRRMATDTVFRIASQTKGPVAMGRKTSRSESSAAVCWYVTRMSQPPQALPVDLSDVANR